jgi:hypothetical protein
MFRETLKLVEWCSLGDFLRQAQDKLLVIGKLLKDLVRSCSWWRCRELVGTKLRSA